MATDCPSCRTSSASSMVSGRLRRRASDRPQPVLLTANPAFEDVHVADEFGDEARPRLLVDFAGRRHLYDTAAGP